MGKKKRPSKKAVKGAKSSRRAELRRQRELEKRRLARKRSRAAKKGWETRRARNDAVAKNVEKKYGFKFKPRPQGRLDKSAIQRQRDQRRFLERLKKNRRLTQSEKIEAVYQYMIEHQILGDEFEWIDLSEYRKKK